MKALVIGGAGFVGHYLIEHLAQTGRDVYATHLPNEAVNAKANSYELDILDFGACKQLLSHIQPDEIYHLAAQSSAAVSWKIPALTVDVNIKGTVNILESMQVLSCKSRLLLVGSGEEYGVVSPDDLPIKEEQCTNPTNVYAVTKATQTMLGKLYVSAYGLDIVMTRSFNHIGPGQLPTFAVSSFCKQIAEIEKGLCLPVIKVGNLSACRDFTDVRDVVRAYVLLIEKGQTGEVYNVGSGNAVSMQSILDELLALATVEITVENDPERMRPADVPIIVADVTKLKQVTEWEVQDSLKSTLRDTLNCWRKTLTGDFVH